MLGSEHLAWKSQCFTFLLSCLEKLWRRDTCQCSENANNQKFMIYMLPILLLFPPFLIVDPFSSFRVGCYCFSLLPILKSPSKSTNRTKAIWWHNLAVCQKPILVHRNHSMCLLFPFVFSVPPCE